MAFSADTSGALPRVGAICRLLMQVRLLLVGITALLLVGTRLDVNSILTLTATAFCSWLAIHHWDRIAAVLLRHPILLGLDVVVSFAVLEFGGPLGPFFLYTVVTAAVAGLLYRWRGVIYFCSLQVLCYYTALGMASGAEVWTFQALIGQPAYYPLVGFVGVRIRGLLDEQARTLEDRRQAEVTAAAADERARLAREMHDSLAKTLHGIAMSARALSVWASRSPERAAAEAERIASAAEIASREARGLIADLRADDLDQPLAALIHDITQRWADNAGMVARMSAVQDLELPILARYEITAVLKEALINVERHAQAGSVDVSLVAEGDQGILTVMDDGCGFDLEDGALQWQRDGHYGLVGMYERAARANGELTVRSDGTSGGTAIQATFPLTEGADDSQGEPVENRQARTRQAPRFGLGKRRPVETR